MSPRRVELIQTKNKRWRELELHFKEAYITKCRANGGVICTPVHQEYNVLEEDNSGSVTIITTVVGAMQMANNISQQPTNNHITVLRSNCNSL